MSVNTFCNTFIYFRCHFVAIWKHKLKTPHNYRPDSHPAGENTLTRCKHGCSISEGGFRAWGWCWGSSLDRCFPSFSFSFCICVESSHHLSTRAELIRSKLIRMFEQDVLFYVGKICFFLKCKGFANNLQFSTNCVKYCVKTMLKTVKLSAVMWVSTSLEKKQNKSFGNTCSLKLVMLFWGLLRLRAPAPLENLQAARYSFQNKDTNMKPCLFKSLFIKSQMFLNPSVAEEKRI